MKINCKTSIRLQLKVYLNINYYKLKVNSKHTNISIHNTMLRNVSLWPN